MQYMYLFSGALYILLELKKLLFHLNSIKIRPSLCTFRLMEQRILYTSN
jgi:hypothetical protein